MWQQPAPYLGDAAGSPATAHSASYFRPNSPASQGDMSRAVSAPASGLLQEVKLYKNNSEREMYDNMADLFAIVQTVEYLEKAYIRDSITPQEYTPACEKLIAQFKTCMNLLKGEVSSLEQFMKDYKLSCPAALSRLQLGVPATVEHGGMETGEQKRMAMYVAETVSDFITIVDALKLGERAVDQLHPYLSNLMNNMNKINSLPSDFEGKTKVKEWLAITNQMKASDELTDEQVRQMTFDIEQAHNAFYRSLAV